MAEPRGCGDPDIYTAVQWMSAGSLNTQQPFGWEDTALVPLSQMQHGGTENQSHVSQLALLVQGEDGLQSPTVLTTLLMVSLPPVYTICRLCCCSSSKLRARGSVNNQSSFQ